MKTIRRGWFVPILAIIIAGTIIVSAIYFFNEDPNDDSDPLPKLTLGAISSLDASSYPGGDYPDYTGGTVIPGNTYDFGCLLNTSASFNNVVLNITIIPNGGASVSARDVTLQICDYNRSNSVEDWSWTNVHLRMNGTELIGFCAPSWDVTIDANGSNNLNNAFRITFETEGDFSIQINASNTFLETVHAYLNEMASDVNDRWETIQFRYQHRIELIPGLIAGMNSSDKFPADLINNITMARSLWIESNGNISNQLDATMRLDRSLSQFLEICENYPEVQSDVVIQDFVAHMMSSQMMIDASRIFYNDVVREYNIAIGYPYDLIAQQLGFFPAKYYSISY